MADVEFPYRLIADLPKSAQQQIWRNFEALARGITENAGTGQANGIYGDGSDGAVTFDGSTTVLGLAPSGSVYTLERDIYLTSGTINSGVTVFTNRYRIFVTGTLTNAGTISALGGNGTAVDSAGNGGAGGASGSGDGSPNAGPLGVTNNPGGSGNLTTAGGTTGSNTTNAIGGRGGNGGGIAGGVGLGTASLTATAPSIAVGGLPRNLWSAMSGVTAGTPTQFNIGTGGAGGSGQSGGGTHRGGGGGGAGGIIGIYALLFVNTGLVTAAGGNGSNGGGTAGNAGGGGGGGGGAILFVCGSDSTLGTYTVAGGLGGSGFNAGGSGAVGLDGNVVILH